MANAVDWEPIQRCAGGVEGSELLKKYGEMTARLSPRVSFIPTVTLNGLQGVQGKILKDLVKEVCNAYQVRMADFFSQPVWAILEKRFSISSV